MNRLKNYKNDLAASYKRANANNGNNVNNNVTHNTNTSQNKNQSQAGNAQNKNTQYYADKWKQNNNSPSNQDSFEELDKMIGLSNVKIEIAKLINFSKLQKVRMEKGLQPLPISLHTIFTGNPGTGKTSVARILGKMYAEIGLLSSGHVVEVSRADLVDMAIGGTAIKTKDKIEESLGGILFIDEAYMLVQEGRDFGQEAIDTILKEMEDKRGEFVVIAAGYSEPMSKFIYSNPGLKSRFTKMISFEDYSAEELYEIFKAMCQSNGLAVDNQATNILKRHFQKMYRNRDANFANGRDVRNFFENVVMNQAQRIANIKNVSVSRITEIIKEDFCIEQQGDEEKLEKLLDELNGLVGLSNVKKELSAIINHIQLQNERDEAGLNTNKTSLHMVFTGSPGTGKTTVARLLAKIFAELSVVTEGQLIEKDRAGLVAGYVGQTAIKTQEAIQAASGGILFIDEAYSLVSKYERDFGPEAIQTLLKGMEDNRENLVVIVAGYEEEMNEFVKSNPGLESRFTRFIHFQDYTPAELTRIFEKYCEDRGYTAEPKMLALLKAYFEKIDTNSFGNARGVRNIFEKTVIAQESRLMKMDKKDRTVLEMNKLTLPDLLLGLQK